MIIVGAGCGPGMLTEEAIAAVKNADLIYGSKRAIELCKNFISSYSEVYEITDYKHLHTLPDDAVVLSTGDPMLAGLGYLKGTVIPGISSLQYSFAKLKISLIRAVVVNAHGKDHNEAIKKTVDEIKRGYIVFLIADPGFDTTKLCDILNSCDSSLKISVCENLGYQDERIATGPVSNPPERKNDLFTLIAGKY
ncbi:MAG: cobalt-precorrin-7 (C(5))-methyltransferase [Methanomicrobium sp.]|nr:cobalt-precorrin-7 (C(5))-methyltransferase [Methanomicrobium sp.]